MNNKILHVLLDDKFTDYAVSTFTSTYDGNEFVVITARTDDNLSYSNNVSSLVVIPYKSEKYNVLLHQINNYQIIIFHSLQAIWIEELFANISKTAKVAWVFWGGEVYDRADQRFKFLGAKTKRIFQTKLVKRFIKNLIYFNFKNSMEAYLNMSQEVFKRIDFCITDLEEDYIYAQKTLNTSFIHAWYNYYNLEEMLGCLKDEEITSNNILLGNSMTLSNNHIEAIDLISLLDLKDRKVFTPLNYGDLVYREQILKVGFKKLGLNFYPLLDFLSRSDYNNIILSCSVCIMNHYRHQALGNTISVLWFGAKVYLSDRSTTFAYLNRLGVIVYSIEDDLKPTNKTVFEPLSRDDIMHNRAIIYGEYGRNNILLKTKELINLLISE